MTENQNPPASQNQNDNPHENKNGSPQFDWVTQRAACSLPKVFKDLRLQIEQDVKTRNSLRPNYAPYEFSLADVDNGFKVLLTAKDLEMSVTFILTDHAIQVRSDKGSNQTPDKAIPILEVTLSFNEQGECKLRVDGQDREPWQVRRMALEDLMFHAN